MDIEEMNYDHEAPALFGQIRLTTANGDVVLEAKQPIDDDVLPYATFEGGVYLHTQTLTRMNLRDEVALRVAIYRERPTLRCGRAVLHAGESVEVAPGVSMSAEEIVEALDPQNEEVPS